MARGRKKSIEPPLAPDARRVMTAMQYSLAECVEKWQLGIHLPSRRRPLVHWVSVAMQRHLIFSPGISILGEELIVNLTKLRRSTCHVRVKGLSLSCWCFPALQIVDSNASSLMHYSFAACTRVLSDNKLTRKRLGKDTLAGVVRYCDCYVTLEACPYFQH